MALECQPGWICQSTSPSVSLQISSSRVPEFRSFACWMVSHSWYLPYSGATDSGQPSGAKTEISSCRLGAMAPSDGNWREKSRNFWEKSGNLWRNGEEFHGFCLVWNIPFLRKIGETCHAKGPQKKTGLGPRTSLYLLKWEEKEIGGIILVEGQPHVKLNIPYMIP